MTLVGSGLTKRLAVAAIALMACAGSLWAQASTRPGMGAVPYSGGVTFRVWAPNASAVRVAGTFNSFSATATPLYAEAGGNWSVDVPGATEGQQYKFVLVNGANTIWKKDPLDHSRRHV